jgi:hypothetical protein
VGMRSCDIKGRNETRISFYISTESTETCWYKGVFQRSVIHDFHYALALEGVLVVNCHGQPIRGNPQTWELNAGLTSSHLNQLGHYEILNITWDLFSGWVVINMTVNLRVLDWLSDC